MARERALVLPTAVPGLSRELEDRVFAGAEEATRFFMGDSDVRHALEKIVRLLEEDGIPYAVVGAMALNAYGYLASGISAPHRLRDLADVLEIIRILQLPEGLAEELNPYVREKFRELWQAAQVQEAE